MKAIRFFLPLVIAFFLMSYQSSITAQDVEPEQLFLKVQYSIRAFAANENFIAVPKPALNGDAVGIYDSEGEFLYYIQNMAQDGIPLEHDGCNSRDGAYRQVMKMAFSGDTLAVGYYRDQTCVTDTVVPSLWIFGIEANGYEVMAKSQEVKTIVDLAWVGDEVFFVTENRDDQGFPQVIGRLSSNGEETFDWEADDSIINLSVAAGRTVILTVNSNAAYPYRIYELDLGSLQTTNIVAVAHRGYIPGAFTHGKEPCHTWGEEGLPPTISDECSVVIRDFTATASGVITVGEDARVRYWNRTSQNTFTVDPFEEIDWRSRKTFTDTVVANENYVFAATSDGIIWKLTYDGVFVDKFSCGGAPKLVLTANYLFASSWRGHLCRFEL